MSPCRLLLFLLFCLPLPAAALAAPGDEVASLLRRQCERRAVDGETLRNSRALIRFYRQRNFQPAWSDGQQLAPAADELIETLSAADREGLNPRHYHQHTLTDRRSRFCISPSAALAAELDVLLSDAFMLLSTHYLNGRIDPATVDHDWHIPREKADPVRMLNQALASGRIRDSLLALLPAMPGYAALRNAWHEHNCLATEGGWPKLSLKQPLRPGTREPAVSALRQRLVISGDLTTAAASGDLFDAELETAVRRFQCRHGLVIDGVVGRNTVAALNVSAAMRARQLELNLERWRWLPRQFGDRYLAVNVPAFQLELVDNGQSLLSMRVIVGRPVRHTPVFVEQVTYLVLNPYWEVPRHLAVADLLPKIQADPGYLRKFGIDVFDVNGNQINPGSIAWQHLGTHYFPYHLRQKPGTKNSLGRIKFIFPNDYNVYLHDTPTRELFERERRSFSSGCIRIEQPLDLALLLLRGSELSSRAALEEALATAVSEVVPLPTPVPIYLLYQTAWVDPDGTVNFRPDLYQRDPRLDVALHH